MKIIESASYVLRIDSFTFFSKVEIRKKNMMLRVGPGTECFMLSFLLDSR